MNRMVLLIFSAILLLSFVVGMVAVLISYERLAPIWLFGKKKAAEENIRVIENRRHYLRFSNDPAKSIPRNELGSLNTIAIVARLVLIPALAASLLALTVSILRRSNPGLAEELRNTGRLHQGDEVLPRPKNDDPKPSG